KEVLAAYRAHVAAAGADAGAAAHAAPSLAGYLDTHVFAGLPQMTLAPDPAGAAGYRDFLARYEAGLAAPRAAEAARRTAASPEPHEPPTAPPHAPDAGKTLGAGPRKDVA